MRCWLAAAMLCAFIGSAQAEVCTASVYSVHDKDQNGTKTASGIPLDDRKATVAHKTLPLRSLVTVTHNGKTMTLPVTDRGPYVRGRCIDLSVAAAILLGCKGLCPVKVGP